MNRACVTQFHGKNYQRFPNCESETHQHNIYARMGVFGFAVVLFLWMEEQSSRGHLDHVVFPSTKVFYDWTYCTPVMCGKGQRSKRRSLMNFLFFTLQQFLHCRFNTFTMDSRHGCSLLGLIGLQPPLGEYVRDISFGF